MTKVGLGLPGLSVADVRASAEAVAPYDFDSFSVYGDLGDLPPYAVLHAVAGVLERSKIEHIGPMGVPVGMQHPEVITTHALALDEQLPGRSSVGLVRGAFLGSIGEEPASRARLELTATHLRQRFREFGREVPPLYVGGFGPKLLGMAGRLGVQGVKLGGSANAAMAERARRLVGNPDVSIILGAVSVIDRDRKAARAVARVEVAKYLAVVGGLDPTLDENEQASLALFRQRFNAGDSETPNAISDALLDKFALAGTPEDALHALMCMDVGGVERFEFGTPHGLGTRPEAFRNIGETILKELP